MFFIKQYFIRQLHNVPHYEIPGSDVVQFLKMVDCVNHKKNPRFPEIIKISPENNPHGFKDDFLYLCYNVPYPIPRCLIERIIKEHIWTKPRAHVKCKDRGSIGLNMGSANDHCSTRRREWHGMAGPNWFATTNDVDVKALFRHLSEMVIDVGNGLGMKIFEYDDPTMTQFRRDHTTHLIDEMNIIDSLFLGLGVPNLTTVKCHVDGNNDKSHPAFSITGGIATILKICGVTVRLMFVLYMKENTAELTRKLKVFKPYLERYEQFMSAGHIAEYRKTILFTHLVPEGCDTQRFATSMEKGCFTFSPYSCAIYRVFEVYHELRNNIIAWAAFLVGSSIVQHQPDHFWYICDKIQKDPCFLSKWRNQPEPWASIVDMDPYDICYELSNAVFEQEKANALVTYPRLVVYPDENGKPYDRIRKVRFKPPVREGEKGTNMCCEMTAKLIYESRFHGGITYRNWADIMKYYGVICAAIQSHYQSVGTLIRQHIIGIGASCLVLNANFLRFAEIADGGTVDIYVRSQLDASGATEQDKNEASDTILTAISHNHNVHLPHCEEGNCKLVAFERGTSTITHQDTVFPGQALHYPKSLSGTGTTATLGVRTEIRRKYFGKDGTHCDSVLEPLIDWTEVEQKYKFLKTPFFWSKLESKLLASDGNELKLKRRSAVRVSTAKDASPGNVSSSEVVPYFPFVSGAKSKRITPKNGGVDPNDLEMPGKSWLVNRKELLKDRSESVDLHLSVLFLKTIGAPNSKLKHVLVRRYNGRRVTVGLKFPLHPTAPLLFADPEFPLSSSKEVAVVLRVSTSVNDTAKEEGTTRALFSTSYDEAKHFFMLWYVLKHSGACASQCSARVTKSLYLKEEQIDALKSYKKPCASAVDRKKGSSIRSLNVMLTSDGVPKVVIVLYWTGGIAYYLVDKFGNVDSNVYLCWPEEKTVTKVKMFGKALLQSNPDKAAPEMCEFLSVIGHAKAVKTSNLYMGSSWNFSVLLADGTVAIVSARNCVKVVGKCTASYAARNGLLGEDGLKGLLKKYAQLVSEDNIASSSTVDGTNAHSDVCVSYGRNVKNRRRARRKKKERQESNAPIFTVAASMEVSSNIEEELVLTRKHKHLGTCYSCNKKGHLRRFCPELLPFRLYSIIYNQYWSYYTATWKPFEHFNLELLKHVPVIGVALEIALRKFFDTKEDARLVLRSDKVADMKESKIKEESPMNLCGDKKRKRKRLDAGLYVENVMADGSSRSVYRKNISYFGEDDGED